MLASTISYDKKFDVFYFRFSDTRDSYADEDDSGVVTLKDIENDAVTGMIIYRFKERMISGELAQLDLPVDVDWNDPHIYAAINK